MIRGKEEFIENVFWLGALPMTAFAKKEKSFCLPELKPIV